MACVSRASVWWGRRGVHILVLFWILPVVPPSLLQPPLPLSLPVHMSVVPQTWQLLPLSQAELGPLFSNSSPFSFSQSLFMVPSPGQATRPGLRASFGPYSVTQLISEPVLPLSPLLSASLLSEHEESERDEGKTKRFRVHTLFHKRGSNRSRGTCITLHAFKETAEHKASCITQPPLGLCVVTLTLPSDWFEDQHTNQSHQDLEKWHSNIQPHRRVQKRERQQRGHLHGKFVNGHHTTSPSLRYHLGVEEDVPWDFRYQRIPMRNQIQLYYSFSDIVADMKSTPPGCLEDKAAQSQRQLFYIKAVTLKEQAEETEPSKAKKGGNCLNGQEEEGIILDPHVMIRYHRGPVLIGQPIRVSVNVRANFSAEFVVIRMKVKKGLVSMVALRTLTSDLWAVTLEKSQGSKQDVVSILCHKHSTIKQAHNPTLLQQVVCLSVSGLRQSFGVAMTVSANWWVEYSGPINPLSTHAVAVSIFSFADRHIFSIAPITESNTIINTAILTNQPVSLPVIVLAINHDGKVSDVTSAVTCHSTNEDAVKVSSNCSTIFVDGSESGLGNTCAVVEFLLGVLSGSVCVEVWAPSLPLQVSLADPVLNAIDGWNHVTKTGCVPVYQRSSVQVLTQFTAQDSHGRTTHLLGSPDWFVDVTELVRNWLRVEDPRVASLDTQNNLIGLQPGKTSLHVISELWAGVLGRCDITVTSEPVTTGHLYVQVVSGLGMSVKASPTNPSIVTTTVTAYNILYNQQQEASISVWLQFSDDTASLLSSYSDLPFFLRLSSLAETVVLVTPGLSQHILAQGDGGGPLLHAELLVSTCPYQPIIGNRDWTDTVGGGEGGVGGGTRRLARGSGWIRVNLYLGFLEPVGNKNEKGEKFESDISDMLVESDSYIYAPNIDQEESESVSSDYYDKISGKRTGINWKEVGNGGMVSQNNLERAVLMPSQEEGAVYFSPSQEKEIELKEEEVYGQGARELDVGVGTVLSLIGLFAVLFLANCLPCTLRGRRTTMEERNGELERDAKEEEERERKNKKAEYREEDEKKKTEVKDKIKHEVNNKEDVKEVEIIC